MKVSTLSFGVGYKIAMMVHQRCKPCLCLFYKGKEGSDKPSAPLSIIMNGDRNLDVRFFCLFR